MKKTHSTRQVAELVGIHPVTLHRWIALGKVKASLSLPYNGRNLWRWTEADVEKVRNYKTAHYGKGKGPKPKGRK